MPASGGVCVLWYVRYWEAKLLMGPCPSLPRILLVVVAVQGAPRLGSPVRAETRIIPFCDDCFPNSLITPTTPTRTHAHELLNVQDNQRSVSRLQSVYITSWTDLLFHNIEAFSCRPSILRLPSLRQSLLVPLSPSIPIPLSSHPSLAL